MSGRSEERIAYNIPQSAHFSSPDTFRTSNINSMLPPRVGHHPSSLEVLQPTTNVSAIPDIGRMDLKMSELCAWVDRSVDLQDARIFSTESYYESAGAVTHRYLILELRRHGLKDAWLRLDRRKGETTSILRFLRLSSVTPANDRVSLISADRILT